MAQTTAFENASAAFRAHLPDLNTPRFTTAAKQDLYEYAQFFKDNHAPPWLFDLTQAWEKLYQESFKGVTTDGTVKEGLFARRDEGLDIESITQKAEKLLSLLDEQQKQKLMYPINAREWRAWSNPEMVLRPFGLRLEEVSEETAQSILSLLSTTLSPSGYQKALAAMRINHFLGECVHLPAIMNKYSYNFLLFGTPSTTSPWGFLLYGHHLCIAVYLHSKQIVISPTFTGAEPNVIDSGEWEGTAILHREGELGLQFMRSLSQPQRDTAQVFKNLKDEGMKITGDLVTDTWNKDDQRHQLGAFRDNRVVPPSGLPLSSLTLTAEQRATLLALIDEMLAYLPEKSRKLRVAEIEAHFGDTWWTWIGGYADDDAFYFRVQSDVVVLEFDHHSGVFLTNVEPGKWHTHTIVRTPNGGDYGGAIRGVEERLV
ncbi:unnamed protein product [Periconia digitata]|uniref:DUF3500 domain containing protein n=1 Tax=Periconia digitata TaxID=1303443 RepID=A0A9W4XRE4_9PLEO|nr:unnamed protein product [Periconia digitata]